MKYSPSLKLFMSLLGLLPLLGGCIYTVGDRHKSNPSDSGVDRGSSSLPADLTSPTIAIYSMTDNLTVGETTMIDIQLSEHSSDFTQADIDVVGGSLLSFKGTGSRYSAVFSPFSTDVKAEASISVSSNAFSDASGNFNRDGSELNNKVLISIIPLDYECDGFMHTSWGFYSDVPINIVVHGGMKEGRSMTWRWANKDSESDVYRMGPPTHHNFGHKNARGQLVERKSDVILSYYWNGSGTIDLEKCEFVWDVEGAAWELVKPYLPYLLDQLR